ncbi:Glycosyl transferase family 25 [Penicillium robsamsonii]|uniref:Glycosyl transferase family 25 n=1 Tax=Penicillium robsamsonii TaxID=1792511 RepID=UPI0025474A46|nr:Glycosyl transferase family 25 [Penicillium robsamsonii]KAJ5823134.1 Glycosyl transferase family 25 [Penicillium robsamsonii]
MIAKKRVLQVVTAALAAFFLCTVLIKNLGDKPWSLSFPELSRKYMSDSAFEHIKNRTLGFQHVYAISMKERTDKRDFLTLAASISGFNVEWLDGVRPDELAPKAMPDGLDPSLVKPTAMACWRAHMNALVNVISNDYSTALILEDDADWDVSLKSQLGEFARGLHTLKGTKHVSKEAPYGTDWDLLWIGGCASGPNANETSFYAIPMDPTVSRVHHRATWGGPTEKWKQQYPELAEDSTRFIYRAEMGCCMFGYAVTTRGARNILSALSIDRLDQAVDNALSDLCAGANGRHKIECWAPFPNLIGTYRKAGSASRDSDIEKNDAGVFHEEQAWNIVYSTRRNIQQLVANEETVYSQWKDEDVPWSSKAINHREFVYPGGYLVN